jgi:ATP-dependent helicase/DNAse subunit B
MEVNEDSEYYKKINHFNEWLNSVTNRSTSMVPENIINAVQREMEKDQITDPTELDKKLVRLYLKRLGQSKYYDATASIICTIAKIPPLNLPPELEDQLREMFKQIQEPYERVKPATRSSFLSYSYVIHQMLKLLDYHEHLHAFPLLKSQEKLRQQDQIWEGICKILDWLYMPTI